MLYTGDDDDLIWNLSDGSSGGGYHADGIVDAADYTVWRDN
jgi:hypothetical protein